MTQENPPSSETAKKRTLKSLLTSKPAVDVEISVGRIYLYPLRVRDMTDFENLEPGDAVNQIRAFLPSIGSLIMASDEAPERIPLDVAIAMSLSDDEIERVADAYAKSPAWQTISEDAQERKPVVQEAGEMASAFLVRLFKAEVEDYHQRTKRTLENLVGSSRGLFDQVRKSTSALGSTLSAYEELTKFAKPAPPEIHTIQTSRVDKLLAEQARERAEQHTEEMALTRLTGQMTAESAKTLKDLAEAATTLMEQMDKRDRSTDATTRKQIKIALWSVVSSVVLSLIAVIFAGFSLFQDWNNNTAGDEWQAKLLTSIEQGNQQRSTVERENQALREQAKSLHDRIADLNAAQSATVKSAPSKQEVD